MPRKKAPPRRVGEAPRRRRRTSSEIGALTGRRYPDEANLQKEIIQKALAHQWKVFHQGDMRKILIGRGFPDLVLVSRQAARILFAEIKMPWGEITQEQIEWGGLIQSLQALMPGVEYHLWTPHDMPAIHETLKTVPDPNRQEAFTHAMTFFSGLNKR